MVKNLILDVETIDLKFNFICDISWGIIQRNKLIEIKNFIVLEYLDKMATGSFSGIKMTETMTEVKNGNAQILPYADIMEILKTDILESNYIYAYNASFDRSKIIATAQQIGLADYTEFFQKVEIFDKWRCLWAWACNTILHKKSFVDWCEINGFISEKGNCKTSAETTLKFITQNLDYVEQHTARQDVKDEYLIYLTIKNAVKKEYQDKLDENDFKGTWHRIKKFRDDMNG